MKKTFLTALSIGLFVLSSVSFVQALPLELAEDYQSLFNPASYNGYTVVVRGDLGSYQQVLDSEDELIGYKSSSFSGIYLGTVTAAPTSGGGNPITESDMEFLISRFLKSSYSADLFLKVDGVGADTSSGVTLTVGAAADEKSGTWTVTPTSYALDFYGVKAAQEWALYFVDPAVSSGKWSTENLLTPNEKNIPEISHFAGTVTSTPIPEPTVTMLFALGVAGFAGMVRRNVSKR